MIAFTIAVTIITIIIRILKFTLVNNYKATYATVVMLIVNAVTNNHRIILLTKLQATFVAMSLLQLKLQLHII
jgi:hypothetical protein